MKILMRISGVIILFSLLLWILFGIVGIDNIYEFIKGLTQILVFALFLFVGLKLLE